MVFYAIIFITLLLDDCATPDLLVPWKCSCLNLEAATVICNYFLIVYCILLMLLTLGLLISYLKPIN